MRSDKCKNCGGDLSIHNFETNQCPVNGMEASIGKPDTWKATTFERDASDELAELREMVTRLTARIDELYDQVEQMHYVREADDVVRVWEKSKKNQSQ